MAKRKSRRKSSPMREGTCRVTKNWARYCKRNGIVRFVARGGTGALSGARGRRCVRKKTIVDRNGVRRKVCARYSK